MFHGNTLIVGLSLRDPCLALEFLERSSRGVCEPLLNFGKSKELFVAEVIEEYVEANTPPSLALSRRRGSERELWLLAICWRTGMPLAWKVVDRWLDALLSESTIVARA